MKQHSVFNSAYATSVSECKIVFHIVLYCIPAATDERLRKEGVLPVNVGRSLSSVEEQAKRVQAITQIDGEAFVQQSFVSNRSEVIQ